MTNIQREIKKTETNKTPSRRKSKQKNILQGNQ